MAGLGENDIFQFGLVGAESVHGCDALDGSVEFFEELVGYSSDDFGAVAPAQHVFVGDDDAVGFPDGFGDGFPIVGRERAQVHDFDGDAFAKQLRGGYLCAVYQGTVRDDADLGAFRNHASFAERDGVIGAGVFGAIVGLAIEMLVLEKHDRIVAADSGAEKTGDIKSRGRHHDAEAGAMGENRFAALAVVDGAASQIAANRYPNDNRSFERAIGAPAHDA